MLEGDIGNDILIRGAHIILPGKNEPVLGDLVIIDGIIEDIRMGGEIGSRRVRGLETIDAEGSVISPPFFDGHMHFYQWSISSSCVDLSGCRSIKSAFSILKEVEGGKIENQMFSGTGSLIGVDLDDSLFSVPGEIDVRNLNDMFPDTPVLIRRICGHKAYANNTALDLLDISDDVRGKGILCEEDAMSSLSHLSPGGKQLEKILKEGRDKLYAMGVIGGVEIIKEEDINSFQESYLGMGGGLRLILSIVGDNNKRTGVLKNMDLSWSDPPQVEISIDSPPPIIFSKLFSDGSIGAGTASFYERYKDGTRVDPIMSKAELSSLLGECSDKGLIPMIHAIGDMAISEVVDVVDGDQCVRIEHAEGCDRNMIGRIEKKEIALCVQPNFRRRWGGKGSMYEKKLGVRGISLNPIEDLFNSDIPICFGTDMMPPDPLYGIYGHIPWGDQGTIRWRNSIAENIKRFTSESVRLSFAGGDGMGNIVKGIKADLLIIDGRNGLIREIFLNGERKLIEKKV